MPMLYLNFWLKYHLGQKYYAPQVRPNCCLNWCPHHHDSAFHVTETPSLTTQPSVTYKGRYQGESQAFGVGYSDGVCVLLFM